MSSQLTNIVFIVAIAGLFWFMVVRPQQQRAAKQREMLSALTPGDEIVTIGGIYGVIMQIDERIRIRVADGSELEIAKGAVGSVVAAADDETMVSAGDSESTDA